MDLSVLNTLLNGATIITFVAFFWWQNQRGNIITRRENTQALAAKDEIIVLLHEAGLTKDATIAEQARQLTEALETQRSFRSFIDSLQDEIERHRP